jgi:hypothetical protein
VTVGINIGGSNAVRSSQALLTWDDPGIAWIRPGSATP